MGHLAQSKPLPSRGWYRIHTGRFANDPVFKEIAKFSISMSDGIADEWPTSTPLLVVIIF